MSGLEWPTVTVIVLSYNSRQHLQTCLTSLRQLDYPLDCLELMLVDNASSDGSAEFVEENFPEVTIVRIGANLGFSGGNNIGAHQAQGKWIAFLNPDMRVAPNWLREMVSVACSDPDVACVGSRILNWNGRRIDFGGAAMSFCGFGMQVGLGRRNLRAFNQNKDILFACGGAMLIHREIFLQVGGFDEDFFSFFEDVDLGWRLWILGYKVRFAGCAVTYHVHHGSWGKVPATKRQILYERNALYTILKNYEDASLERAWPASIMLLVQRAFVTSAVDPAPYRLDDSFPVRALDSALQARYDAKYYWREFWHTLRQEGLVPLLSKVGAEIGRRWRTLRARRCLIASARSLRKPDSPTATILPQVTLSYLAAAEQVLQNYERMMEKRQAIQAARVRADQEIFSLFGQPIMANYLDEDYIRAVHTASEIWGLYSLFEVE